MIVPKRGKYDTNVDAFDDVKENTNPGLGTWDRYCVEEVVKRLEDG
jgi:hypothetical protein